MLAIVEVAAKQGKAADEEGQRTPPPPQLLEVAEPRQPTPDHPPYCWMIGEAIDALAEDGDSSEDSISAFIRVRHPDVPPWHDRLLRHYLGRHVAEGVFVRTAAGLYERCPEENADEDEELLLLEQAEAGSCKPASVEAKRGRRRGRPRGGVSPSTPPKGRKDGGAGAQWMTLFADSSSTPASAAAAKDSVPMSLVAVGDKDGSQAPSLEPKRRRRRRLRKLGMDTTMDSSGEVLVAGKKDGSEVPYTLDKEHEQQRELGLVIFSDSSATSTMDKACTEVPPTTPPVGGDQPLALALVTTSTEVPVTEPAPTPAMDEDGGNASSIVDKNYSICTMPTAADPCSQACKLALMAAEVPPTKPLVDGGQPLDLDLVTTTEVPMPEPASTPAIDKDGGDASSIVDKNDSICPTVPEPGRRACTLPLMAAVVPPTKPLVDGDQPLDLALMTTTEVPVSEPVPTPPPPPAPAMDKDGGQPLDLALVTTTEVPVPEPVRPTSAMGKDRGDASSIMDKNESICTTPTVPEPGSQACKLALMAAAAAGFVPLLVANKKAPSAAYKDVLQPLKAGSDPTAGKKAPSATYKDVLQPRKAGSAPTAGKKAGGKALSVSALLEARRRQHKSATAATGDGSALTPGKKLGCKLSFASPKLTPVIAGGCPTPASVADQGGMEASVALKQQGQPHKLYPVIADEISDDPGIVVLALPSTASNAQLQNLGTSTI